MPALICCTKMIDERLDPEVRTVLAELEALNGPPIETLPVNEARQVAATALRPYLGESEPVASVEDMNIAGAECSIPIRLYTPAGEGLRPALVYLHGGGWVLCDLETHDVLCRRIANDSGAVVIAVHYRRAPEHKFPAALVDCYATLKWVAENAERLGIDSTRIAVGGDSAGGNLTAAVCLKARQEGGPAIALQVLVYPVTNLSNFDTASYEEFADGYFLTASSMKWFRDCYLKDVDDAKNPLVSPLLEPDLTNLPPALVITAEYDVLRDEGEAYAERLRAAGVPVTSTRYAAVIHPFFSLQGVVKMGQKAVRQVASALAGRAQVSSSA